MTSEDVFSPFGILKKVLPQYSYRSGQEEMAKKVETAFNEGRGALIEAGTGIGKSFAYLVPSFLLIQKNRDSRVVIATSTTNLQKQLYEKDIPFLSSALGFENESTILYGRNRYICLRRYEENRQKRSLLSLDESTSEAKLDKWILQTDSGSVLDINNEGVRRIASPLTSDEDDCLRSRCPFFDQCYFYKARRSCQKAKIIVTNHHLVLSDAQIRWENNEDFSDSAILPQYTHLVFDEAHHIENEATESFSDQFSFKSVRIELDSLVSKNQEFGGKNILEFLSPYETKAYRNFSFTFPEKYKELKKLLEDSEITLKRVISDYEHSYRSLLFNEEFYSINRCKLSFLEPLSEELNILGEELINLHNNDSDEMKSYLDRVKKTGESFIYYHSVLSSFISFSSFDSVISYAKNEGGSYTLVQAPLLAGPLIKARILDKIFSYLFCSATLSTDGNFNFFKERLGLKDDDTLIEGIYYSPFDYKKNLMYLIPLDGKEYNKKDNSSYEEYSTDLIYRAILSSSGGALVLFTSKSMMNNVYNKIKEKLGDSYNLLLQSDDRNKDKILKDFKSDKDSCLFATYSFWEGVDVPGDALRLLIIVKLPFLVPTDPVNKARSDYLDRTSEKHSFVSLTVPNAMIKLKQGIGRLIRSETDRGVVLVLDGRLVKKSYSRLFFNSIPPGYIPEDTFIENMDSKIERFLF